MLFHFSNVQENLDAETPPKAIAEIRHGKTRKYKCKKIWNVRANDPL